MTETVIRKVLASQPLLKEARNDSDQVVLNGIPLRVFAGEKVRTGAREASTEHFDSQTIKWVFVEAIAGLNADKRKGFVDDKFLVAEGDTTPEIKDSDPFPVELTKEDFAYACFVQAARFETNPAYLYALAYSLSGVQWSETHVRTHDFAGATAVGVFRFSEQTWRFVLSDPAAKNIGTDWIKFPDAQCIVAAIVAAKSADLLKRLITERGLSAVDLFLAHLFTDDKDFGSKATEMILKAERDDKSQPSEVVIKAIYPDSAERAAFFERNANIFKEDGSATIEQALKNCTTKLDSGFTEVDKVARQMQEEVEADVFGNSIPPNPAGPILGSVSSEGSAGTDADTRRGVTAIKGGIDRRKFIPEVNAHPELVARMATMVKGEVGWTAPLTTKQVQLESFLNRMLVVGKSIAQGILPVYPQPGGYYPPSTFRDPATPAQIENFRKDILAPALAGSHVSEDLLGFPATGNASGSVARHQYERGTRGDDLPAYGNTKESYFLEHPAALRLRRLLGGESISTTPGVHASHAGAGSERFSIDQKTRDRGYNSYLAEAQEYASRFLPSGWHAEIYSGYRGGSGHSFHRTNEATDVRIYDDKRKVFDNYQAPSSFRVYEKFAQDAHRYLEKHYPQLAKGHRWGGYFGGRINPEPPHQGGTYGAADLMHQDFGGLHGIGTAAGSWKDGLNKTYRGYFDTPRSASKGMSDENAPGD
jgi:hypothetical protein